MAMDEFYRDKPRLFTHRGYTEEHLAQAKRCIFCTHLLLIDLVALPGVPLAKQPCGYPVVEIRELMLHKRLRVDLKPLRDLIIPLLDPTEVLRSCLPFPIADKEWMEANKDSNTICNNDRKLLDLCKGVINGIIFMMRCFRLVMTEPSSG